MTQRSFCSFEKNRCPTLPPTVEYSLRWLCGASHAKGWAFSTTSLLPTIHRRMVWLRGFTASLKIPCPKPMNFSWTYKKRAKSTHPNICASTCEQIYWNNLLWNILVRIELGAFWTGLPQSSTPFVFSSLLG